MPDLSPPPPEESGDPPRLPRVLARLPFRVRVGIFIVGWVLIAVGIAGLVLPGIQGVLTIVTGAALLSLDNEMIYRLLRKGLGRWPHLLERIEHLRERTHEKLHRLFHRGHRE